MSKIITSAFCEFILFLQTYNGAVTAIATIFIAFFTIVLAYATRKQARLTRDVLSVARNEFISTHRPRLRIRNIVLDEYPVAPERVRYPINVRLYISNIGDTDATITNSHCDVFWTDGPLPMKAPYDGESGNDFAGFQTLKPGGSTPATFVSEGTLTKERHLAALGDRRTLHVMGWVAYADARRTAFCRKYRVQETSWRFFAVDDPDYEYED